VHVSINNNLIVEAFWPARGEYRFDVSIPQSYLREGDNIIQVECPLTDNISQNVILVDWFEVDYNKAYVADGLQTRFTGDTAGNWEYHLTGFGANDLLTWDITDPLHPVRITNTIIEPSTAPYVLAFQQNISSKRQYLAASPVDFPAPSSITPAQAADLHAAANGADYIIITHPDFLSAVQPLADHYTQKGLRVKVVDVQDVYDEFGNGVFDPAAIQAFLAYTYVHWISPAPTYVLLVGDGNYDFKNYYQFNEPNYIPPYLAEVDPWIGETAADNRYVAISGNDILPDMALGRLPVRTSAEASAAIGKILAYAQNYSGDWAKKALFVAANNDPSAGNFAALSDAVINNYLGPIGVSVDKIYYMITHTTGVAARQAIVDAINDGRGLVHFSGHSNLNSWYGDPNIPNASETILLDRAGAQSLASTGKFPIVISMTCLTGYYVNPSSSKINWSTLDENLIRAQDRGAVAVWSPTGEGVASGHDLLDSGLFQELDAGQSISLGLATNQAKYYLFANSTGNRELIDTYILFGDPATQLNISNPTAVTLASFIGQPHPGAVQLDWETANEVGLEGFNIYRSDTVDGEKLKLNTIMLSAQKSGQPQGAVYQFINPIVQGKQYFYWLELVFTNRTDLAGPVSVTTPYWLNLPAISSN
jgi:hypothetical protein